MYSLSLNQPPTQRRRVAQVSSQGWQQDMEAPWEETRATCSLPSGSAQEIKL